MELIFRLMDRLGWERVILALLHSLWQGALVGVVVWFVLRQVPASRARLRYGIAVAGLFMVLVGALVTFEILGDSVTPKVANQPIASAIGPAILETHVYAAPQQTNSESPTISKPALMIPQKWTWLGVIWLAGSCIMLARAVASVVGAGRLLNRCEFVTDPTMLATLLRVKQSMRIARPVRMATGASIHIPAVLGTLVPVILLPLSALGQMPVAHLEMILAHELAHIRRHDYLINLLQLLIEALLFFNPAIWWLSRQVRIEREACCDAMAVTVTGKGSDYARSLAEIVAGLVGSQAGLGVTPAMAGEGSIVDRVRRVLAPMSRPIVRLPWYRFIGTSVVAIVLLAGMWGGTHVAVAAAEKILSPAEQVDKIAQLKSEIDPASQSDHPAVADLHGSVRAEDGAPLPKHVWINIQSQAGNFSTATGTSADAKGNFSCKITGRRAWAWVHVDGFAPAVSPELQTNPDGKFPAVALVLKVGFDQTIRLVDEAGHPVSRGSVKLRFNAFPDSTQEWSPSDFACDAQGQVVVHHATEMTALVVADIHGYQHDAIPVTFTPDSEPTVKLVAASPTSGTVSDEADSHPLAGAKLFLMQSSGFENGFWPAGQMPLMAITDGQGNFTLDTLRTDSRYTLWITAGGHASALIRDVRRGMTDARWPLSKPRTITLKIDGPAGAMPRTVKVTNPYTSGDSTWDFAKELPVKVKDGVGIAVLDDPLPGTAVFSVGQQSVRVGTDTSATAELNLGGKSNSPAMRKVVLKLDYPNGGPMPQGRLQIHSRAPRENSFSPLTDALLNNGVAKFDAPVGSEIMVSQGSVVGYALPLATIEVPEGKDPLQASVSATLAGAVSGNVFDADAKRYGKYFFVSLLAVDPPPGQNPLFQPFNSNDGSGRFLVSPVPLGGKYRLVAVGGARVVLSEPITIDAGHMIQQVDLTFAAGVTVSGTVLGADGVPISDCQVELDVYPVETYSFAVTARTDRDGKFIFEHVDPKVADYDLSVAPVGDAQGFEEQHLPINEGPVKIQLKPGVTAKGKILDVQSGAPMSNTKVSLQPKTGGDAQYRKPIEVSTDQNGLFEAHGLEEIDYKITVYGTFPPDSVVQRDATGKSTGVLIGGKIATVHGGSAEEVEIKLLRP